MKSFYMSEPGFDPRVTVLTNMINEIKMGLPILTLDKSLLIRSLDLLEKTSSIWKVKIATFKNSLIDILQPFEDGAYHFKNNRGIPTIDFLQSIVAPEISFTVLYHYLNKFNYLSLHRETNSIKIVSQKCFELFCFLQSFVILRTYYYLKKEATHVD